MATVGLFRSETVALYRRVRREYDRLHARGESFRGRCFQRIRDLKRELGHGAHAPAL